MSARPPPAANPSTKKPRRHPANDIKCLLFLQGNCKYGSACKFIHQAPDDADATTSEVGASSSQVALAERSSMKVVQPVRTGSESAKHPRKRGKRKSNATPKSQRSILSGSEPTTANSSKKSEPCRCWISTGKCPQGNVCSFRHDPQEYCYRVVQESIRLREEARNQESIRLHNEESRAQEEAEQHRIQLAETARLAEEEIARQVRAAEEAARKAREAGAEQERIRAAEVVRRLAEEASARQVRAAEEAAEQERIRVAEANRRLAEAAAARQARAAQKEAAREARQKQQEAARKAREEAKQERIQAAEANRLARLAEEEARQARAAQQEAARKAQQEQEEVARKAREEQQEARRIEIANQEAAFAVQHVVFDFTVITFGAGAAIQGILTGFESCRVHIKDLPLDANSKEVSELFTQQGINPERFYIIGMNNTLNGKQEAHVICPEDAKPMAIGLDGIEFRQEKLTFEVFQNSSAEGMKASAGSSPDVLTISWRAPSVSFVATYNDAPQVQAKVRQLDGKTCAGRKVKVEVNRQPGGQHLRYFSRHAITIRGLPPNVMDAEVEKFCGSNQLRRLKSTEYDAAQVPILLRHHIETKGTGQLKLFGNVSTNAANGISTVHVHFNTWDQAKQIYDSLDKQRFWFIGNAFFQLRLDNPFQYAITIPIQQYRAQRKCWDSLHNDMKDKKGYNMVINARDRVCIIHVGGNDRKAVGSLKVRVEVLAAGEKMQGWHRSFGTGAAGQRFLDSVLERTGAFVRNDKKNRALKVFGEPSSVEEARIMVVSELERLESLEQTVFLKRQSVRYFMRHGLAALKEELGEDNVTLSITSFPCTITIRGAEAARHSLSRHIEESLQDSGIVNGVQHDSKCPICYDEITSPAQLACGHSYCTVCIRHFLTSACELDSGKFPLSCMGDEDTCGIPISLPAIQRYLPPQQFKQLLEAAFFTHIERNPQEFKYCTTPDCSQVYRSSSPSSSQVVHCPSCFSAVCSSCHEEGHEGMTCTERRIQSDPAEQERLNDELARQSGFKKCPECNVWIEKTEGCNHMECRCGAHICWVCMGIFTSENIYPHMHTAHGGIHTAGLAAPAAPAPAAAHIPFAEEAEPEENYALQQELLRQAARRLEQRRNLFEMGELHAEAEHHRAEQVRLEEQRRREEPYYVRLAEIREAEAHRIAEVHRAAEARRAAEIRREAQVHRAADLRRREQERTGWGCVVM